MLGSLKPNEQLPAIDKLAKQMGVSSPTAKKAIDELAAEGWLESRHGVGTFVRVGHSRSRILLTAPRNRSWETFLSEEILEEFQSQHPHIQILLSSEPTTDLVVVDSYSLVVDRLRRRRLQSLDDLRKRLGRESWSLPGQLRSLGSHDGALFGLPMRADLMLLQVNPQMLDSEHIELPKRYLDWQQRKEILVQCQQDRDGDGVNDHFGAFSKLALYEWLVPFWQRGGRLDSREAFLGSDAIQVLDELWEMHHKSRILPVEMTHGQSEFANGIIHQRFQAQQIAMRWVCTLDVFEPSPIPTTILLPRFGPTARQEVHASLIGIHKDCEHPDVAMEFLDFCYRRFIRDNQEYPFALSDGQRQLLREATEIHRLLQEGLSDASEPLQEGYAPRTWAIEREILDGFRLLRRPDQMLSRLREIWGQGMREDTRGVMDATSLILPWTEVVSPVGQFVR